MRNSASRTAERVAERRAAHQLLDSPLVFDDPLAVRIIAPEARATLTRERSPLDPYFRAAFAVRSRFAEDALSDAVKRGLTQYVVLGAGFDTFAYRNPFANLRVFEVDHPATQRVKRERLAAANIAVPENVVFLPVDFSGTRLDDALPIDRSKPAFFSWLGVVPYLELPAIRSTFRYIAGLPRGSEVVFDYGIPRQSLSPAARFVFDRLARRVASAGEPFRTFFDPPGLIRMMREEGFADVEDFGPGALNGRYFAGRGDGLRVGDALHIARGIV
ncbi:MAG TPA: class I SAM-dependent methyltransferase [Thermoanaerobaculia bacterium]